MNTSLKNILILSLSLFMLASAAVIVKFSTLHPLTLLCWRLGFVVIILFPFYLSKKQSIPNKIQLLKISFVSLFLVGHFYTWFRGVPLLPVSVATIIYATNPIYTAVISHFVLKEEYRLRYFVSFLMAIIGIVLIVKHDLQIQSISIEGVSLMITSAIFYSCYMTLSKRVRINRDNTSYSFYLNLFSVIISITILILINTFSDRPILWIGFAPFNWWVIVALAIFASVLGHTLMTYSVAHLNLNFVSIFKLMSPMLSSILAFIVFGEKMTSNHFIGFLFVASGVIISLNIFNKRS